jgi:hypothetical protein
MSIETIATFAGIFSGIVASADIIAKVIGKKDAKKEARTMAKLFFIGPLGAIVGLLVWVIGSPILGGIVGYGLGAIIASIIGAVAFSFSMTIFIKKDSRKGSNNKIAFIITVVIMSVIYWLVAWVSLNDLYNHKLAATSETMRGILANVVGWALGCVVGNISLLAVSNFIEVLFRPEDLNK